MKAVISGIIFFLLVCGGFFFISKNNSPEASFSFEEISLPEKPIIPEGKFLYRRPILHFEITYPDTLIKRVYNEGNTTTVTLEDAQGDKGLQIFVVPYKEETISEARFKMDLPSGVIRDPIQVLIDGVTATAFYSQNAVLGETREVWFVHNGLLYEVNARKDLDAWLAEIMRTWKFI